MINIVLGAGFIAVNKTKFLLSWSLHLSRGKVNNKQTNKYMVMINIDNMKQDEKERG